MHILTADQVRAWDEFTILHEPVASIELMERAAKACVTWLFDSGFKGKEFIIFCGKGNNGGDGLAIARMLSQSGHIVQVYILESGNPGTSDFQTNLQRLHPTKCILTFLTTVSAIRDISKEVILIDALLGTGLNRPLEGLAEEIVKNINGRGNTILSIDIPSGLFADKTSVSNTIIKADITLTFQCLKPAFIVAENDLHIGRLQILKIGLLDGYLQTINPSYIFIGAALAKQLLRPRKKFAHKGNFGHALLVAGSYGKIGAALLAARAILYAGAGLLTVHIPGCGYPILQTGLPEAMVDTDKNEFFNTALEKDISKFGAIGIGPGLGMQTETKGLLKQLLRDTSHSLIIDADALNLISNDSELLSAIPPESILTPHFKEFERLAGAVSNDFERLELAKKFALRHQCIIILKGHFTCIVTAEKLYVNSTGNAGMAKGGSGDVLTGVVTGLFAQGYTSVEAAILGVFLHGKAADLALTESSYESMMATDIIDHLPAAFRTLY